jgi:hypothetical protein
MRLPPDESAKELRRADAALFRDVQRRLENVLFLVLGAAGVAVFVGAIVIMWGMDSAYGGRFYVVVVAMLLLGAMETVVGRTMHRRWPLRLDLPFHNRGYGLIALLALAGAGAVLIAAALYLP